MTTPSVVREKEFAKRLEIACENNPHSPSGHGRQSWLRERIMDQNRDVRVSPEAVRKWFSGESRPRPTIMSMIARALEVDEAWLSLGITPVATPRERSKQSATAAGAVNLVAGHIQLVGGNIAFPEDETEAEDVFAIVRGKRLSLVVRLGTTQQKFKLTFFKKGEKSTVIAVVPTNKPSVYEFVRVPANVIENHGKHRGGFVEIEIEHDGSIFFAGGEALPIIHSFDNLDGELPKVRKTTPGIKSLLS